MRSESNAEARGGKNNVEFITLPSAVTKPSFNYMSLPRQPHSALALLNEAPVG